MLCINNTSKDIYFSLAAEEYLLKNHQEDIFMLWQSDNAVVLGKHQNLETEIDQDFVNKRHISIARRYSGGGTVFQDRGNINLTFIKTTNHIDFSFYTQCLLDFLFSIGLHAQTDRRHGITIDQLKISGSAQCIYKNRILYHCTLLYSTDLESLKASLNGKPTINKATPHYVKSVKSEVTNINRHLTSPPGIKDFRKILFIYFLKQADGNRILPLSQPDIQKINELRNRKYITDLWISGKSS